MRAEAQEKRHTTAADAAKVAKKAKVKLLVITHISNRYKETAELLRQAKAVFRNSEIAHDGMEIEV